MNGYSYHLGESWILDCQFELQTGDTLADVSFIIADSTGAPVVSLNVGNGVEIVNATAGTATVSVPDEQQAALSPSGRYTYTALITTGAGFKELQSEGTWVVLAAPPAA